MVNSTGACHVSKLTSYSVQKVSPSQRKKSIKIDSALKYVEFSIWLGIASFTSLLERRKIESDASILLTENLQAVDTRTMGPDAGLCSLP